MNLNSIVCLIATLTASVFVCAADLSGPQAKLTAATGAAVAPTAFGDLNRDLVYTPVTPCRIADTRSMAAGPIAAGSTRSFVAVNSSNYASQGGSSTNCGTIGLSATVVMIVATAVTPNAPGFATAYAYGTPQPAAASMQFAAGAIAVNTLAIQTPNPNGLFDFAVFTSAQSHFVFDIVGYYAPPLATALDCATVSGAATNVAAGAYTSLPTLFCAASYTPVSLSISAGENVLVADSYTAGNAGQIFVRSLSVNAQNVTAKLMCCRVPGR
ncbi:MAG: hypothetical protein EAZ43_04515 [Betaproteobacteria bacterium]|nr:MAG: hypothetical protein EAZ43_04515 [Betaproteobacteria bacterium]